MSEVEKVYKEFWEEIICNDGEIDIEQVKKELHDYHFMLESVPKVYMEITGGRISKPNTCPYAVIDEYWENVTRIVNKELENN